MVCDVETIILRAVKYYNMRLWCNVLREKKKHSNTIYFITYGLCVMRNIIYYVLYFLIHLNLTDVSPLVLAISYRKCTDTNHKVRKFLILTITGNFNWIISYFCKRSKLDDLCWRWSYYDYSPLRFGDYVLNIINCNVEKGAESNAWFLTEVLIVFMILIKY